MSLGVFLKTVKVRISGQVQGVGFRYWMVEEALRLGLYGWVRNRPEGEVEALILGRAGAVDLMIENCADGPRYAYVANVHVEEAPDDDVPDDFEQRI